MDVLWIRSRHDASSSELLIKIQLLCSAPRAHVTYVKLPRALRVSQLTFYARRVAAFSARYGRIVQKGAPYQRQQIIVGPYRRVDRWGE